MIPVTEPSSSVLAKHSRTDCHEGTQCKRRKEGSDNMQEELKPVEDKSAQFNFRTVMSHKINFSYYPKDRGKYNTSCITVSTFPGNDCSNHWMVFTFYANSVYPKGWEKTDISPLRVEEEQNLPDSPDDAASSTGSDVGTGNFATAATLRYFIRYHILDSDAQLHKRRGPLESHYHVKLHYDDDPGQFIQSTLRNIKINEECEKHLMASAQYFSENDSEPGLMFDDGSYSENGGAKSLSENYLNTGYFQGPYRLLQ